MRSYLLLILLLICSGFTAIVNAQDDKKVLSSASPFDNRKDSLSSKDSATKAALVKKDTIAKHIPRIATKRSALIPGWGQAYNKEYWKIPIVYGVIAIPTVLFFTTTVTIKKQNLLLKRSLKPK